MPGMITIKILRGRVQYLTLENSALRREISRLNSENTRLRNACEVFDYKPKAEPPPPTGSHTTTTHKNTPIHTP